VTLLNCFAFSFFSLIFFYISKKDDSDPRHWSCSEQELGLAWMEHTTLFLKQAIGTI